MSIFRCVGCGKGIGNRAFVMDDNGEIGCPACFTEDASGECWNRHLFAQGMETRQGGDAQQAPSRSDDSPVPQGCAPTTPDGSNE